MVMAREKISHNAYKPKVGNINMGLQRFTSKSDNNLYKDFKIVYLGKITRTTNNLQNKIDEWIIILEKMYDFL